MHFYYPVNKNATHSLRNERLILHVLEFWLILSLGFHKVIQNVRSKFSHMLRVTGLLDITILNSLDQMVLHSLQKLVIYWPHLLSELLLQILLSLFFEFFYCGGSCTWALRLCPHMNYRHLWSIPSLKAIGVQGGGVLVCGKNRRDVDLGKIGLSLMQIGYVPLVVILLFVAWFVFEALLLSEDAAWVVELERFASVGLGAVHRIWLLYSSLTIPCSMMQFWVGNQLLAFVYWSFLCWGDISCAFFLIQRLLHHCSICGIQECFFLLSSLIL